MTVYDGVYARGFCKPNDQFQGNLAVIDAELEEVATAALSDAVATGTGVLEVTADGVRRILPEESAAQSHGSSPEPRR